MCNECKWIHEILEDLSEIKFPFNLENLPDSGIYFFYEKGELWGHGGLKPRIVRIGTHRKRNFRIRINDHYLIKNYEERMNFNKNRPKPSDRSIFRKNIGRAILNKRNDKYLEIWEIDFTRRENRQKFGNLRDIEKEKSVEEEINYILRNNFSFRFLITNEESERIGTNGLESKLIGSIAKCDKCKPSENWLGNFSPKEQIKNSGLWLVQHLNSEKLSDPDMKLIEKLVVETKNWVNGG